MQAQIEFYDQLERQYHDARIRLQGIKQELGSFEKIMTLLKDHINDNLNTQKRLLNENNSIKCPPTNINDSDDSIRKQIIVKESYDKLQAKYERFRMAKIEREDDYKRQLTEKIQLEGHLNSMKTQIASIKKLQEAQEEQLNKNQKLQESTFDYDVETINFLNECNWNLGDSCDRGLAETLLSCFPSGTFLVRSSKTKQNSFALSVVANSMVRHCLIDKLDNDEYCFHPPGPQRQTYSSLCNLVMDYRHKSLLKHNPELDTNLIYPVLSQLKKTSKGSTGGMIAQ